MEEMNRIIPAEKIKTEEEFKEHEANYEYCRKEQKWYATAKDPKQEIINKLKDYIADLDSIERGSEQEQALLRDINLLQVKLELIKNNVYDTVLQENMNTELKLMREYKLNQKFSGLNLAKGLIKNDKKAKERRDYIILRLSGRMGSLTSLDVIPNSNAILDFTQMYKESFVDIDVEEVKRSVEQQISLVVYHDQAGSFGDKVAARVNAGINAVNKQTVEKNKSDKKINDNREKEANSGISISDEKKPDAHTGREER